MDSEKKCRAEHELPEVTAEWDWKYHHLGIPTKQKMPGEKYLPQFKFFHSGFPSSPFGVEWMRFEEDSPVHPLIQNVPHLAFEVDDLEFEINERNLTLLSEPNKPMEGVRVAMIEHNGAPIELLEFEKNYR
jgi:hypothetical protein